jgi:hypothetical protein
VTTPEGFSIETFAAAMFESSEGGMLLIGFAGIGLSHVSDRRRSHPRYLMAAFHFFPRVLIKDPLHDACADAKRSPDFVNAIAFCLQLQYARLNRGLNSTAP